MWNPCFKKGILCGMIYPARLRITFKGVTRIFDSPEQAERFHEECIRDSWKRKRVERSPTHELTILLGPLSLFFYFDAGLSRGKAQLHCWRGPQTMNSTTYYSILLPVKYGERLSIMASCNLFCFTLCVPFLFCLYVKCGIYSKKYILNLRTCGY